MFQILKFFLTDYFSFYLIPSKKFDHIIINYTWIKLLSSQLYRASCLDQSLKGEET